MRDFAALSALSCTALTENCPKFSRQFLQRVGIQLLTFVLATVELISSSMCKGRFLAANDSVNGRR